MGRPLCSACLIVRDEADHLARCLDSIRDAADEIVVVDTGSADATPDIARRYTPRVYHHPWEGDFAAARNRSLAYARGEWILVIDADEVLEPRSRARLRDVLAATPEEVDHLLVTVRNLDAAGRLLSLFPAPRLLRNGRGLGFASRVHNQVAGARCGRTADLVLLHYGYDLPAERMEAKFRRTVSLLEEQLRADPADRLALHNLCLSLADRGEHGRVLELALPCLERMDLEAPGADPLYLNLCYLAARAALGAGRPALAAGICERGLAREPAHLDCLFFLAVARYRLGDHAAVAPAVERWSAAEQALARGPTPPYPVNTLGQAHALLATAGYSAAHCDREHEAVSLWSRALARAPDPEETASKILEFCRAHRKTGAASRLREILSGRGPGAARTATGRAAPAGPLSACCERPGLRRALERMRAQDRVDWPALRAAAAEPGRPLEAGACLLLALECLAREARGDRSW